MTVLSYDLVSDGCYVVEADICENLPLPGSDSDDSQSSHGDGQIVDVVVCVLSLMASFHVSRLRRLVRVQSFSDDIEECVCALK